MSGDIVADLRRQAAVDTAEIARLKAELRRRLHPCPTCQGFSRETVGMVCQTCGRDFMDTDLRFLFGPDGGTR